MKNKTLNKLFNSIKNNYWNILLTNIIYFIGFLFLYISFWIASTNLIEKIGPLLKFYINTAKPMYESTGMVDPNTLTQILMFSDMLKLIMNKIILFVVIFIIIFSILRGIKDWHLLGRKQPAYLHIIVIFAITSFLTFFSIIMIKQIDHYLGFLLIPFLFFIILKYSILLTQGLLVNKNFSKKMFFLFLTQIITWLICFIITIILFYIISQVFSFAPFIGAIIMILLFLLIIILREQYLLEYLSGEQR